MYLRHTRIHIHGYTHMHLQYCTSVGTGLTSCLVSWDLLQLLFHSIPLVKADKTLGIAVIQATPDLNLI